MLVSISSSAGRGTAGAREPHGAASFERRSRCRGFGAGSGPQISWRAIHLPALVDFALSMLAMRPARVSIIATRKASSIWLYAVANCGVSQWPLPSTASTMNCCPRRCGDIPIVRGFGFMFALIEGSASPVCGHGPGSASRRRA